MEPQSRQDDQSIQFDLQYNLLTEKDLPFKRSQNNQLSLNSSNNKDSLDYRKHNKSHDRFQILTEKYWADVVPCVSGKYAKKQKKKSIFLSPSSISIQEPIWPEIEKVKGIVQKQHPLNSINPQIWKNIPICLNVAIQNIIKSISNGGEQLYDFQIQVNERLWKLQKQIDSLKQRQKASEQQLIQRIDGKINVLAQNYDSKIPDITKQISGTMEQMDDVILKQQLIQQVTSSSIETSNSKLEEFGRIIKESLLLLETSLIELNRVTIDKIEKKLKVTQNVQIESIELKLDNFEQNNNQQQPEEAQDNLTDSSPINNQNKEVEIKQEAEPQTIELKDFTITKFQNIEKQLSQNNIILNKKLRFFQREINAKNLEKKKSISRLDERAQLILSKIKDIEQQQIKEDKNFQYHLVEFLNLKNFINDSLNKKINDLILKFEMQISELKQENIVKEQALEQSHQTSKENLSKNIEFKKALLQVDNIRNMMIPNIITRMEQKLDDQNIIMKNIINNQFISYNKHIEKVLIQKVGQNMLRNQIGFMHQKIEKLQKQVDEYKQLIDYKLDPKNRSFATFYSNPQQIVQKEEMKSYFGQTAINIKEINEEEQQNNDDQLKQKSINESQNKQKSVEDQSPAINNDSQDQKQNQVNTSLDYKQLTSSQNSKNPQIDKQSINISIIPDDIFQPALIQNKSDQSNKKFDTFYQNTSRSKLLQDENSFNFLTDNNDEYIKALVRQELETKMKQVEAQLAQMSQQLLDEKARQITEVFEDDKHQTSNKNINMDLINQKFQTLNSQIKVLSSIVKSIKIGNKKKEDDPHYQEYMNFSKILDGEKVNRFQEQIQKMIRDMNPYNDNAEIKQLKVELQQFVSDIQQNIRQNSPLSTDIISQQTRTENSMLSQYNTKEIDQKLNSRKQQRSVIVSKDNTKKEEEIIVSDTQIFDKIQKNKNRKHIKLEDFYQKAVEQKSQAYTKLKVPKILNTSYNGQKTVQNVLQASKKQSNNILEFLDDSYSRIENSQELSSLERTQVDYQTPKICNAENSKTIQYDRFQQTNNHIVMRSSLNHKLVRPSLENRKLASSQMNRNNLTFQNGIFSPQNSKIKQDVISNPNSPLRASNGKNQERQAFYNNMQALNKKKDEKFNFQSQIKNDYPVNNNLRKSTGYQVKRLPINTDFTFLNL